MPFFGQKLLNTQHTVGRCAYESALKESPKKSSLKPNAASHNNTSWHTDTWLLEYSPSRGSLYYKGCALQKIILFGGGHPSYTPVGEPTQAKGIYTYRVCLNRESSIFAK